MKKGQITGNAAEIYEALFLPALFSQWPPHILDRAQTKPGDHVLDVACGTGVVARAAVRRIGDGGSVTGLDVNPVMLEVARRKGPSVQWVEGRAERLPFEDEVFDIVACQFGLMFFDDKPKALNEMMRVLKWGGRMVVAVWDSLENSPGYRELVARLHELFGPNVAAELREPFSLGQAGRLASLFAAAGLDRPNIDTVVGTAQFSSVDSWVDTNIKGWTLSDMVDNGQHERLLNHAGHDMSPYMQKGGGLSIPSPAHIAVLAKLPIVR